EGLPQGPQHLPALPFEHGHEPTELQPGELDRPGRADNLKTEVGEEVLRENSAVDEEALVVGLALRIAVRERLQGSRALVLRLADGCEKERLEHPGARAVDQVGARDEDGVVGRRSRRKLERT